MLNLNHPPLTAQFRRTLGYTAAGGAELSECLSIVKQLENADSGQWYQVWTSLGDRLRNSADEDFQKGNLFSSGEKLLRASNYYRTAYFFLEENANDDRIITALKLSKSAFYHALQRMNIRHIHLQIPFEDYTLPGYLFLSEQVDAPLLIDTGGGDSTLEELYLISTVASLKRGYHSLIFEGPGQGSVLRLQKKPFRPDWETVIGAVLNYIQDKFPQLLHKVALRGDSFGGYLAARAASADKRIGACVLNPGIKSPNASLNKLSNPILRQILFLLKPSLKFKIKSRFMRFGAKSFSEFIKKCQQFTLHGRVKDITCPTLIIDNEEENLTKGEAQKLFFELQCPKKYYQFTSAECTGGHCQPLGQQLTQELIFNWLESHFANKEQQLIKESGLISPLAS